MAYQLDLKKISIADFSDILTSAPLIPSWKILEVDIEVNLNAIKDQGIENLDALLVALKTKEKIEHFSGLTGLSVAYLTVLNRMVKGYLQKPIPLKEFTWIDPEVIRQLEELGIKNTRNLYENSQNAEQRKMLADKAGLDVEEINRLSKLSDLTRIRWVNHTFAYILLLTGYDTPQKVANANYLQLYEDIKTLNEERKFYNAHIGQNDMKMVIDAAQLIDYEIAY